MMNSTDESSPVPDGQLISWELLPVGDLVLVDQMIMRRDLDELVVVGILDAIYARGEVGDRFPPEPDLEMVYLGAQTLLQDIIKTK